MALVEWLARNQKFQREGVKCYGLQCYGCGAEPPVYAGLRPAVRLQRLFWRKSLADSRDN